MAKTEQILRLMLIAEFLKGKPNGITYEETKNFLERKFQAKDLQLKFSEKTFKRDRELISEILGIENSFKRSSKTFKINNEELEKYSENILDHVLLIDAYRNAEQNSKIMIFENRKSKGLHHLSDFIEAIKKHKIVSFEYLKFDEEEPQKRTVVPYALKEFKYRWYLLAIDYNKKSKNLLNDFLMNREIKLEFPHIKTFALDRISDVEIHHTRQLRNFKNFKNTFKYSFGIISTLDQIPQEIILSFTTFQGKYIKSLPLHHSQEILIETDKELRIKLMLCPTFDFKQEILSHGKNVTVISPSTFRDEIKNEIKLMVKNYNENY